jgi:polyisoprenoid-binding protein YceI
MLALEPRKGVDLDAIATVTIHGVSKDLPIKMTVTYIPGDDVTSKHLPGDWLKVDANWDILLTDFGVKVPGMAQVSVSDKQHVEAHVIATTIKAKKA